MIIDLPVESTHCPQLSKISLSFITPLAFFLICPLILLTLYFQHKKGDFLKYKPGQTQKPHHDFPVLLFKKLIDNSYMALHNQRARLLSNYLLLFSSLLMSQQL